MKFVGEITDPVHRNIRFTDIERELLDTAILQRLRRIKQLSGAHLVYPSAHHSRFEHSIGTMHVAGYAGETLLNKSYLNTEENVQELRLAALLHDVGHGPFSHLFEEILENKSKRTHENLGKEIISRTEISDILERYGYKSNIVCQLSFGESKIKFLNEVIAGALSADIMDYLPRDGLFTGAEYGKIDYHRLISSFEVVSNAHLALNRSAIYSFESMLISRYEMFKAVYFHKTVRSAEVMLLQAMRLADEHLNLTGGDIEDYLKLTDDSTLEKIDSLGGLNDIAVQLVNDYRNRKLLKCVYEKFIHKNNDFYRKIGRQSLNRLALQISDDATVQDSSVFVDKSGASSMPLTPTKDEIRTIMLIDKAEAYETPVSEIPLIDSLTGVFDVLRVYTTSKNRENVRQSALKILGVEHFSASRKQGIT
ncbi:HD domain-containing protein [Nitrososphaera sp. AFS]|uniref:HD domain-containing protein n=1 Tax=Nitrososphaera sp. AFS TaxID=2301191 RepID=UPI00139231FC|nr:HD domain-containing protein [Nitrososphaera sp. AFS]NAL77344.1 HD domain-containing protein [Nitrososphaera sp. AFS]